MSDTIEKSIYRNNLGHYRYRYGNSQMTISELIVDFSKNPDKNPVSGIEKKVFFYFVTIHKRMHFMR